MEASLRAACRRIRVLRGLRLAADGLTVFLLLGLPLLLARASLPLPAMPLLTGLGALGLLAGFAMGALRRLDPFDAARLLDARLGLQDRLATGVEFARRPSPSPMERAALAEARATLPDARRALPLSLPVRRLPAPAGALAVALLLLTLPPFSPDRALRTEDSEIAASTEEEAAQPGRALERPRPAGPPVAEAARRRDGGISRSLVPSVHRSGEEAAEFRDTPLSGRRPDFGSFIREGDERLKLLGKPGSIPDLKQDFTRTPYQMALGRMQEMLGERSLKDLSPEELKRLLSEMDRLARGKKGGLYSDDFSAGSEGEMGGPREEALRQLEEALSQLRERGGLGQGRSSRELEGTGRQTPRAGVEGGEALDGSESDLEEGGQAGTLPGAGASPAPRDLPTPRLRGRGVDTALRGQARDGPTESYSTNMVGRGDRGASRLPPTRVLTRYRQMMEETLIKDPIPPDYREQVKRYFDSLEGRR